MANLDNLIRWHEYVPDLGENRKLTPPFTVLLAVGLTKPDLQRLAEALEHLPEPKEGEDQQAAAEAKADALAKALAPHVKLGPEPLFVGNEAVDSLPKLLRLYMRMSAGAAAVLELALALRHFNGVGGQAQLFFERLSGGSGSTDQTSRAAR